MLGHDQRARIFLPVALQCVASKGDPPAFTPTESRVALLDEYCSPTHRGAKHLGVGLRSRKAVGLCATVLAAV